MFDPSQIAVGVRFAEYVMGKYRVVTVASVSPSGKWFTVKDGRKFDDKGHSVGSAKWHVASLETLTDEIMVQINREAQLHFIKVTNWEGLDNETIAQIANILRAKAKKE